MDVSGRILGGFLGVLTTLAPVSGVSVVASQPSHANYCHSYYYNYDQCERDSGGGWGGDQGRDKHAQRRHGG
jgi:hypothetical protein